MEYTWKIANLNTHDTPYTRTVVSVDWELSLTNNSKTVSTWGRVELPEPQAQSFIEFEQLSQDVVVEWVKAFMGNGLGRNSRSYDQVLSALDQQMDAALTQEVKPNSPPWANE